MDIQLTQEQQTQYQDALNLIPESSPQLQKAREEVTRGVISLQTQELLKELLQNIVQTTSLPRSSLLTTTPADYISSHLGTLPTAISYPPLNLEDVEIANRVKSLRKNGIQNNEEIEFALRYIETVAPKLSRDYLKAYRNSTHIQILVDDQLIHFDGLTSILPISFFDRDAIYPRRIRLKKGTSPITLVHELFRHSMRQKEQIELIRNRPYPIASKEEKFGEIRDKVARAIIHEEAEAYALMFLFFEEARIKDPLINLDNEGDKKLYEIFRKNRSQGENAAIDSLIEAIPRVFQFYEKQIKVLPALFALAAKTNNEWNWDFSEEKFFVDLLSQVTGKSITHQEGQIDLKKAVDALYHLLKKNPPPGKNTIEHGFGIFMKSIDSPHASGDLPFDLFMNVMEAYFDEAPSVNLLKLRESLEKAPSLGPRRKEVDRSKDRGYSTKVDMTQLIVQGWAKNLKILNSVKEEGDISGRHFFKSQLYLAEYSVDPVAGKLYGQAWVLAHQQIDSEPILLIDLADSLSRSGYIEEATEALQHYTEKMGEITLGDDPHSIQSKYEYFLEIVKKLPFENQKEILKKVIVRDSFFNLGDSYIRNNIFVWISEYIDELKSGPNDEEIAEIKRIFEESYPHPDHSKLKELFIKILENHHTDLRMAQEKWDLVAQHGLAFKTIEKQFINNFFSSYLRAFSKVIEIAGQLEQIVKSWPDSNEFIETKSSVIFFNSKLIQLKDFAISDESDFRKDDLTEPFLKRGGGFADAALELLPHIKKKFPRILTSVTSSWKDFFSSLSKEQKISLLNFSSDRFEGLLQNKDLDHKQIFSEWGFLLQEIFLDSEVEIQKMGRTVLQKMMTYDPSPELLIATLSKIPNPLSSDIPLFREILYRYQKFIRSQSNLQIENDNSDFFSGTNAFFQIIIKLFDLKNEELIDLGFQISKELEVKIEGSIHPTIRNNLWMIRLSKIFIECQKLLNQGKINDAKKVIEELIQSLKKDFDGKGEVSVESILLFAERFGSYSLPHSYLIELFDQATLRSIRNTSVDDITSFMNQSKEFDNLVKTIQKSSLLDLDEKDELFCKLVKRMEELVSYQSKMTLEVFTLLKGLKEYLRSERYPKTDYEIYSLGFRLLTFMEARKLDYSVQDRLTVLSYFDEFLKENPWLGDLAEFDRLKNDLPNDRAYQRDLRIVYSQLDRENQKEQVILPDGNLNSAAAEEGNVDLDLFEKEFFEKLSTNSLNDQKISEAVASLIKGYLQGLKNEKTFSLSQLSQKIPFLNKIFIFLENSEADSSVRKAVFQGFINGLSGEFFYQNSFALSELLEKPQLPLKFKRIIWEKLREEKALNSFVDLYLARYIITHKHPWGESDYYSMMGKLMMIEQGKLPRSEVILLFLQNPNEFDDLLKRFKKWVILRNQGGGTGQLNLSDRYDVLFYFTVLADSNWWDSTDNMKRYHIKYIMKQISNSLFENKVFSLDNFKINVSLSNSEDISFLTKRRVQEGLQLIAQTAIDSEPLPRFIESFSPKLRRFFGSVLRNLPIGMKHLLSTRLKAAEERIEQEKIPDEQARGILLYEIFKTFGWVKAGQIFSTSSISPAAVRAEFKAFQDEVPHSAFSHQRRVCLEQDHFGEIIDLDQVEIIKSGSIGEVVRARLIKPVELEDGRVLPIGDHIAIKIVTQQHRDDQQDNLFEPFEKALVDLIDAGEETLFGVNIEDTFSLVKETMIEEMNLKIEKEFLSNYNNLPDGMSRVQTIKKVIRDSTVDPDAAVCLDSSSTLAMEWIDGEKFEPEKITDSEQREKITTQLLGTIQKIFDEVLESEEGKTLIQGDPHPGNYLLRSNNLVAVDLGQGVVIYQREVDYIIKLLVAARKSQAQKIADILIEMDFRVDKKRVDRVKLKQSIQEILNGTFRGSNDDSFTPSSKNEKTLQSDKLFNFIQAAQMQEIRIAKPFHVLLKVVHLIEGILHQLNPDFDLSKPLEPMAQGYVKKRLKKSINKNIQIAFNGIQQTAIGSIPFGVGSFASSWIRSLFDPMQQIPSVEEVMKKSVILSVGGGLGKIAVDQAINWHEGRKIFSPILMKPGEISVRGFARRFVPLTTAIFLLDWVQGKPFDSETALLSSGQTLLISGLTHSLGIGLRKVERIENFAQKLKLVKVAEAARVAAVATLEVPVLGEATLFGACVASAVEFTLLEGLTAGKELYVDFENKNSVQNSYSRAVMEVNDLMETVKKKGLGQIDQSKWFLARKNLEESGQLVLSYFNSRIERLEEERKKQIGEIEEEKREYLLDRGSRSVASIHQMYNDQIEQINKSFFNKINELEGEENQIAYYRLPLENFEWGEGVEISKRRVATLFTFREKLANNKNAFSIQQEAYLADLKKLILEELEKESQQNPDLFTFLHSREKTFQSFEDSYQSRM